jgi:hypothetical protein
MTMLVRLVLLALVPLVVAPVLAQGPASECAASFPARLADAKEAVASFETFQRRYAEARPALEWFEAHCRFLEELERVVRKADDPNAFVCDPKAKGRPKNLSAELVLKFSVEPNVGSFQADQHHDLNNRCVERDRSERIGLVFGAGTKLEQVAHRLLVVCYGDDGPSCVKARESLAAAKAKGKLP